ncbi:hypothetical protein [Actinokineospora sp. NBRC 105648]|uniref:hypothetical protein n=1 Tax=Actinokineospora sp. NBRC 105648 TaxID=3032206 RepID=UPI0024A39BE7|nr:hypothetical protein [Actinokineospora sp. NBRC 105648]GLZ37037.1 hypothetical protein Acsp05_06620 [Actinokineospora sp. NBRC 105648]
MVGDRRANEFWYEFDDVTLFHRIPEVTAAFAAIHDILGDNSVQLMVGNWFTMSAGSGYPADYTEFVRPIADPLRVLSGVQLGVVDKYYRHDDPRLVTAFSEFGQGTLFDPRRADVEAEVHTMDGDPPTGYHLWHVFLRSMMFLGIDRHRWARLDPLIGFAWALQSIAKPGHRVVNPGLPRSTVAPLARRWLRRSPEQLDVDFQSQWYPAPSR